MVKEGYVIERCSDSKLKTRYLMLYSDCVVCYRCKKQRASPSFMMAVKWHYPLSQLVINTEPPPQCKSWAESFQVALESLRTTIRDLKSPSVLTASKAAKKLVAEVLKLNSAVANLPLNFVTKSKGFSKSETFSLVLASEFERTLWTELFRINKQTTMKPDHYHLPVDKELSKLLKSTLVKDVGPVDTDGPVGFGEMVVEVQSLQGLDRNEDIFVVIEADCYGEFRHVARTKLVLQSCTPVWNERLVFRYEAAKQLRVLLYAEFEELNQLRGLLQMAITPELSHLVDKDQQVSL